MIGVGVIPAVAESTGNAFASPDETLVTTETTSINAASEAGQQAALENAFGTGGGQASGATAGSNNSTSDSATSSVSGDVMEAAIVCADPNNPDGLRSHFDKVLQDQQELAIVQVDTDSIFNADPEAAGNEAIAGCFTAGDQIIDLAQSIPSITPSWGNIGNMVQTAVNKKLQEVQTNMLNRTCEVANRALSDALAPINGFLTAASNNQILNDPSGFLGDYIVSQAGDAINQGDLAFNQLIDDLDNRIDSQNTAAGEAFEQATNDLNDLPSSNGNSGGYDTSDLDDSLNNAQGNVLQGNLENTYQQLQDVIANKPVEISRHRNNDANGWGYTYCQHPGGAGSECVPISSSQYSTLSREHTIYSDHLLPAAQNRYQLAQDAISASNTNSSTSSNSNYQARSFNTPTSTPSASGTSSPTPSASASTQSQTTSVAPQQPTQTQTQPSNSESSDGDSSSNVFANLW